ncbi:MAG: cell division protein FtsQ [Roseivirga sp.]|nr:cell division protein FtsQ [Roseivirga sp.]
MTLKSKTYKVFTLAAVVLMLFMSIGFVVKHDVGYRIEDISVEIENRAANFFIDEEDVMTLVMANERDSILGDRFGRVDLKEIEDRIESHSFVRDAEVFRDLKGHLVIRAYQSKPVARLIASNGNHAYISEKGKILPVSTKYTSRVVVLTGTYLNKLTNLTSIEEDPYAGQLFELIDYINNDKFWSMQIGEVNVDRRGDVVMHPQVGRQRLEFGQAENIEKKFNKLKIFFKQIMPTKGWNAYKRVNVAYGDQIICE